MDIQSTRFERREPLATLLTGTGLVAYFASLLFETPGMALIALLCGFAIGAHGVAAYFDGSLRDPTALPRPHGPAMAIVVGIGMLVLGFSKL